MLRRPLFLILPLLASLAACGSNDTGELDIALVGTEEGALTTSLRLSESAQLVRAATQTGLVTLNERGEVVPALAETWLPTEDGLSYIFRLRQGTWPDGSEMTAASARDALQEALDGLEGTSLARDLAPISEVRAMAGRVIEIQLSTPEPYLLQLLAQPELALRQPGGETGPMTLVQGEQGVLLAMKPPRDRGLPDEEDWQSEVRPLRLLIGPAADGIARFDNGEAALVMGGTLGSLPLVETGPLSSGTLRIDNTFGLFGLQVLSDEGLLGDDGVREGLAMAIDRPALLDRYNIGGWRPTTRPVSPGLPGEPGLVNERWEGESIDDLRAQAAARIRNWRSQHEDGDLSQPVEIALALPAGPGWDRLYRDLTEQLATIGLRLIRVEDARRADLLLVDRVARYPAPRWFMNQFHCSLARGPCDEEVDQLVETALAEPDPAARARLLAQAEAQFTLANVYIPIGSPLRWSLVRGSVNGFAPNAYAFHPLPEMALIPR
ncbi:MAG: ABC transporter substrate-binding protein [Erythrobacter sp.]|nr:ABC transporter substrate-binding protein [Erythrobacter sp.]